MLQMQSSHGTVMKSKSLYSTTLITLLLMTILLSACSLSEDSGITNGSVFSVDKIFRNYYKQLGGKETLGVVISEVIVWEDNQCQYTEKVLLCFNQNHSLNNGYFLFPLGTMAQSSSFGISTLSPFIYEGFRPLYEKVGGEATVGKALSIPIYNFQEERIEQHFENLAFYQKYHNQNTIGLLSLGVFACDEECDFSPEKGTATLLNADVVSLPFINFITRFHNLDALGPPLTEAIELQPGLLQQVFKNAVLIGNPTLPETIHLLDLPVKLNYRQEDPIPQIYSTDDNMAFYIVNSPNGFHVPLVFDEFISNHGGRELSGNPLCEVYQEASSFRQCFQNYCLDYFPDTQDVSMAALGEQYLGVMNIENINVVQFEYSPETVSVSILEKSSHVAIDEEQEIEIRITKTTNQTPLQNIDSTLEVILPNGNQYTYQLPATDVFGISQYSIPQLKRVNNGSVITYSVCLNVPSNQPICVKDSYLIW